MAENYDGTNAVPPNAPPNPSGPRWERNRYGSRSEYGDGRYGRGESSEYERSEYRNDNRSEYGDGDSYDRQGEYDGGDYHRHDGREFRFGFVPYRERARYIRERPWYPAPSYLMPEYLDPQDQPRGPRHFSAYPPYMHYGGGESGGGNKQSQGSFRSYEGNENSGGDESQGRESGQRGGQGGDQGGSQGPMWQSPPSPYWMHGFNPQWSMNRQQQGSGGEGQGSSQQKSDTLTKSDFYRDMAHFGALAAHETASQRRFEDLKYHICEGQQPSEKGSKMDLGNVSDKVNINLGDGGGGGGGLGAAALIAALGNRNQDNSAALIAALGNRNETDNTSMAPLFAAMAGGGFNNGMNSLWPLLLLAGLGRGGGGLFGGGCDGNGSAVNQITSDLVLSKLGSIEGAVPLAAAQTENSICTQTNALTNLINQSELATLQAVSNTKDSIQNATALLSNQVNNVNQSVLTTGLQTQIAIGNDGDKTRALIQSINDANLQRQLAVAEAELAEERHVRRSREIEINVTQQVNQQQAQVQLQTQLSGLAQLCHGLVGQFNRANQDIVNLGTMVASGTQANPQTNVSR